MSSELPKIVFFTSKTCGHCEAFRGANGKPSDDKPWNYRYIRRLLNYPDSNFTKLRASSIVEINVLTMLNNIDNISEINIYTCIPSLDEVKAKIEESTKNGVTFDPSKMIGSAVERISIRRGTLDRIMITVDIDGVFSPYMTEFYNDYYIWDRVPAEVKAVRYCLISGEKIPNRLLSKIQDTNVRDFIMNSYDSLRNSVELFEQQMTTHHFNFSWLMGKILPKQIRVYEQFYPCWLLVSTSEWNNAISTKNPIYARVVNNYTTLAKTGFTISPFSQGETIETLLDSYHRGEIPLHYDGSAVRKSRFSWQM